MCAGLLLVDSFFGALVLCAQPLAQTLGTYDATVRLHPEVVGSFKVIVQKDTRA